VVKLEVTRVLMTVRIQSQDEAAQGRGGAGGTGGAAVNVTLHRTDRGRRRVAGGRYGLLGEAPVPKVGRNEPCPCGSGKKYKNCHGRLA